MSQYVASHLFECMECSSQLIAGGKCLTCDSVQIQIQKEVKEVRSKDRIHYKPFDLKVTIKKEVCPHSVYQVLSFEDDTLECLSCGHIKYMEKEFGL
jgi:hypothetical protein